MARRKKSEPSDLQRAYELVANTPEGLEVLRDIFEWSLYDRDTLAVNHNTGEINALSTIYNKSKRDLWLRVRRNLSARVRALIENQEE